MTLPLCFVGGILLGLFFYRGLKWTVDRLARGTRPALFLMASFLVRLAGVGLGFFLFLQQGLLCLAAGFLGFLLGRVFLTRRYGFSHRSGAGQRRRREGARAA